MKTSLIIKYKKRNISIIRSFMMLSDNKINALCKIKGDKF